MFHSQNQISPSGSTKAHVAYCPSPGHLKLPINYNYACSSPPILNCVLNRVLIKLKLSENDDGMFRKINCNVAPISLRGPLLFRRDGAALWLVFIWQRSRKYATIFFLFAALLLVNGLHTTRRVNVVSVLFLMVSIILLTSCSHFLVPPPRQCCHLTEKLCIQQGRALWDDGIANALSHHKSLIEI